jgi:acetylornithine deacetylase/succinyl-diaminopimelate desuccinylase-like protein
VNVGTISGGTQPNIVPDRCVITIDRRTLPGETETRRAAGNRRAAAREKIVRENFQHEARAVPAAGNESEVAAGPAISAERRPDAAAGR